jgi:hypothetical protein
MGAASDEPNWPEWLLYREVTIETAVALSLNVDPDRLLVWRRLRASSAESAEFDRRVSRVTGWPLRRPNWVAEGVEGHAPRIHLLEFVQYAVKAEWPIPAPLKSLERENGPGPVSVADRQPSQAEVVEVELSRREGRRQTTANKYDTWFQLVLQYGRTSDGKKRTREQIARKVAEDLKAKDPRTGVSPRWTTVKRRLDKEYPGWAEKSWA